jgi:hypothetical protein
MMNIYQAYNRLWRAVVQGSNWHHKNANAIALIQKKNNYLFTSIAGQIRSALGQFGRSILGIIAFYGVFHLIRE